LHGRLERTRWFNEVRESGWLYGANLGYMRELAITQIRKSDKLSDLSTQPLLLARMSNAYCRYLNISRRHTTLFDQCIESLL
jgi:hypothetical protein